MKFANYNQVKLFLQPSVPTARRTRSHDSDKKEDEFNNYAIIDKLDRHPDNIPPEVILGRKRVEKDKFG